MRKIFYKIVVLCVAFFVSCSDMDMVNTGETQNAPIANIPEGAAKGELLIKFKPEVLDILDRVQTRSGGRSMTRSSIPSVDEVLNIIGTYHFERVFPIDTRHEERTRKSGLNLWYIVRFDEGYDLLEVAKELAKLGEIATVEFNHHIQRAYDSKMRPAILDVQTTRAISARTGEPFNDPELKSQWGYINEGEGSIAIKDENGNPTDQRMEHMIAGSDVNCAVAWEKCQGDASIIVAVLDEGVMYTHKDLKANMWVNPGENDIMSTEDNDGNGYAGDKYGYNFVTNSSFISWSDASDTGHGTHVAGTIAAVNNNGIGVCGIAGGNGDPDSGVKIMSCQLFAGDKGVSLLQEAQAIKYAADNGAVILQCSWGYNSGRANLIEGYTPGPKSDKEWVDAYPLEKEALDYFVHNAGSPNGVIEGGLVIYASGNEYAPMAGYPGAYPEYISVAATAADFTPSTYSNYAFGTNISAPGGDSDYHCANEGKILSTIPGGEDGMGTYGYLEGTSMACPHVSGVAALGLSYANKLRKHFTAEQFRELLLSTTREVEENYPSNGIKKCYRNWGGIGQLLPTQMDLSQYRGNVGGMVDAGALLNAIDGDNTGVPMKVPNVYVALEKETTVDLARFFVNGESLTYTCNPAQSDIASVTMNGTVMTVKGLKVGVTKATINVSDGKSQEIYITVRKTAGDSGWL